MVDTLEVVSQPVRRQEVTMSAEPIDDDVSIDELREAVEHLQVVQAARRGDDLVVRQWVADCRRARVNWSVLKRPSNIEGNDLAVAAALVELMAANAVQSPPAWTANVAAASEDVYLVPSAREMRRTREMCQTQGPEPMRKRRILAPPGYLTIM